MAPLARCFRALFGFAILILGAGCADAPEGEGGAGTAGEPRPGGTAVIAEIADMGAPMSLIAQGLLDANIAGDIMNMTLLRGVWRNGRLEYMTAEESPMAIARSYELTGPDSASLRFHMRSDLRWSDGEPLTAEDVAYTYSIIGDPALASPLQEVVSLIDSVEAENDSTVVFHFARRHAEMLSEASLQIIPEHVFGDTPPAGIRNHPAVQDPAANLVVSGPFMLGSWQRGQQITLVRNPQFQPAPYLDQIVFRIIPDPTTRLVELQTGGVDLVRSISLEQVPMLRQQAPNVRLEREERRFYDFVAYNGAEFEAFSDPEIRRALGLASDREGIVRALQMEEFGAPAGGPYAPIFTDLYDPETQAPLPYDPDEARRILDEKGWRDSDADGIRDRNGQPFRFTLALNTGNQRRADVAQILQQQWRQVGVQADIQTVEFNTLNESLAGRNFEAAIYGWSVGLTPDLSQLWIPESPFNFTGYERPEVISLIEQARQQPTPEAANALWREVAAHLVEDQPYTWLYFLDSVDGVNNRLQGTKIDTYGAFQNTWEWWIND